MPGRVSNAGFISCRVLTGKRDRQHNLRTRNGVDYGFRIYDPRLEGSQAQIRCQNYRSWSPYPFAMNRPIDSVDLDGLEFYKSNDCYIRMVLNLSPQLKP